LAKEHPLTTPFGLRSARRVLGIAPREGFCSTTSHPARRWVMESAGDGALRIFCDGITQKLAGKDWGDSTEDCILIMHTACRWK
jgi:hypothetical protein